MVQQPLQVCLDARMEAGRHGGIQHVVQALAMAFSELPDQGERYHFLVNNREEAHWLTPHMTGPCSLLLNDTSRCGFSPVAKIGHAVRRRWGTWRPAIPSSPRVLAGAGVDVMHFTVQRGFRTDLPQIYMPYDLQHRHLPHLLTKDDLRFREYTYGWFCRRADAVVAMSRWGGQDLVDAYGIDPNKITIQGLGSTLHCSVPERNGSKTTELTRLGVSGRFLLYPAQTWAHKNHHVLIRAIGHLKKEGLEVPLVLSGSHTERAPKLKALAMELQVDRQVAFLGRVDGRLLKALYRKCEGLVFPSSFEGFGIPLIEAANFGKPIVCSDLPVLRESAPQGTEFVPVGDVVALAGAIRSMWAEKRSIPEYQGRSWVETAQSFRAMYRQLAQRPLEPADKELLALSSFAGQSA